MLWKAQSPFSIGQWLRGIRETTACMHLSFLFVYEHTKRKLSQTFHWDPDSVTWHLQRSQMHAKAQRHCKTTKRKKKAPEKKWQTQLNCHIHVDKWALWHLQHVAKLHAMQSEWGYNWLSQRASGQPDRRGVLIINHSLMQKAQNDAPKKVDQTELDRKQVK